VTSEESVRPLVTPTWVRSALFGIAPTGVQPKGRSSTGVARSHRRCRSTTKTKMTRPISTTMATRSMLTEVTSAGRPREACLLGVVLLPLTRCCDATSSSRLRRLLARLTQRSATRPTPSSTASSALRRTSRDWQGFRERASALGHECVHFGCKVSRASWPNSRVQTNRCRLVLVSEQELNVLDAGAGVD